MVSITKTLFRTALIGGLALGGLTLVVGPQRVAGGFHQVQYTVMGWFDDNVQDPVILRQQLKKLQQEYPERLRKLTRSLAEVEGEISQIEYYKDVSQNAVEIARNDLASLKGLVTTARAELAAYDGTGRDVLIRFQGSNMTVDAAYSRAEKIKQAAVSNQDKVAHYERELEVLNTYRGRLVEQKNKLDKEYASFQTQLWHIERQIDQIERNEDLIDLMEDCNGELDKYSKFDVRNLDQLSNQLAAIQKENEAVLDALSQRVTDKTYEDRARDSMKNAGSFDDVFSWDIQGHDKADQTAFPQTPVIIDESKVKNQPKVEDEVIARLDSSDQN